MPTSRGTRFTIARSRPTGISPERDGIGKDSPRYDAFITYSHAQTELARRLHRRLETFGRTDRSRPLKIYRDETNLTAGAGLAPKIRTALEKSDWLILIASPEAAGSPWVAQELEWWWDQHGSWDRLLIGVAGGTVAWSLEEALEVESRGGRVALPRVLIERLASEPKYEDISVFGDDRADPAAITNVLASITSPIRKIDKDTLVGYHAEWLRNENRRGARIRVVLTAATLIAAVAAASALFQWREAERANVIANARLFASTAESIFPSNDTLGKLLAVEGYRLHPDSQTTSTLYEAAALNEQRTERISFPDQIDVLRAAPNGAIFVATPLGVFSRSANGGDVVQLDGPTAFVDTLETSRDGRVVAATEDAGEAPAGDDAFGGDRLFIWRDGELVRSLDVQGIVAVGVGPDGRTVGFAQAHEKRDGLTFTLSLLDIDTGEIVASTSLPSGWPPEIVSVQIDYIYAVTTVGEYYTFRNPLWLESEGPDLGKSLTLDGSATCDATRYGIEGHSFDSAHLAYLSYNRTIGVCQVGGEKPSIVRIRPPDDAALWESPGSGRIGVSPDGTRVLISNQSSIWISTTEFAEEGRTAWVLEGELIEQATFATAGRVVTAAGETVTIWSLDAAPIVRHDTATVAPAQPSAGGQVPLVVSSTGGLVVGTGPDQVLSQAPDIGWPPAAALPVWMTGDTLALVNDSGAVQVSPSGRPKILWGDPYVGTARPVLAARLIDDRAVVVFSTGAIEVRELSSGDMVSDVLPDEHEVVMPVPNERRNDSVVISADGSMVAVDSDAGVFAIDTASGKAQQVAGEGEVRRLVFAATTLLVVRSDRLDVVASDTLDVVSSVDNPGVNYTSAAALIPSTNAQILARVSTAGELVLTDLESGREMAAYPLPSVEEADSVGRWETSALVVVANSIWSTTSGAPVARWDLSPDAVLAAVCERAGRDLSPEEWSSVTPRQVPSDLSCMR